MFKLPACPPPNTPQHTRPSIFTSKPETPVKASGHRFPSSNQIQIGDSTPSSVPTKTHLRQQIEGIGFPQLVNFRLKTAVKRTTRHRSTRLACVHHASNFITTTPSSEELHRLNS
ncbi:hypothetical protein Rs2_11931 [Raphanus sativus]|nr:hypothetical protein Rs2_11931 [Raphanus sativus]